MLTNKGFDWASAYLGANVDKQILNSISYGSSYGKKGWQNWQIIALSEGWANYSSEKCIIIL